MREIQISLQFLSKYWKRKCECIKLKLKSFSLLVGLTAASLLTRH